MGWIEDHPPVAAFSIHSFTLLAPLWITSPFGKKVGLSIPGRRSINFAVKQILDVAVKRAGNVVLFSLTTLCWTLGKYVDGQGGMFWHGRVLADDWRGTGEPSPIDNISLWEGSRFVYPRKVGFGPSLRKARKSCVMDQIPDVVLKKAGNSVLSFWTTLFNKPQSI